MALDGELVHSIIILKYAVNIVSEAQNLQCAKGGNYDLYINSQSVIGLHDQTRVINFGRDAAYKR